MLKLTAGQEGPASAVSKTLARLDQRRFAPPPGTVLVREWGRKSHRVMVMPDGFAWNGETFDSLSEIAFAITGTKWNGPRFFGLRDRRPQINCRGARVKPATGAGRVRCAIYTRVSTDQGLDQDFNSLDAQYEAASA